MVSSSVPMTCAPIIPSPGVHVYSTEVCQEGSCATGVPAHLEVFTRTTVCMHTHTQNPFLQMFMLYAQMPGGGGGAIPHGPIPCSHVAFTSLDNTQRGLKSNFYLH